MCVCVCGALAVIGSSSVIFGLRVWSFSRFLVHSGVPWLGVWGARGL